MNMSIKINHGRVAAWVIVCLAAFTSVAAATPNVLLILADDVGDF